MKKNTNLCVDLKTILQNDTILTEGQCYSGLLSRTSDDQFLFEEAVRTDRHGHRNPKLYDGDYVSLVRMQNGRYQCHLRTMPDLSHTDRKAFAFSVYTELVDALSIIQ